jgi:general secretion pathway protein D
MTPAQPRPGRKEKEAPTFSSFDLPGSAADRQLVPQGMIKFQEADLAQVLSIYQELSGRTVVRPASLPSVKITLQNQTPLSRREALQALDTVLAENQIAMVLLGTKFVKAVTAAQAATEAGPVIELPWDQLPESNSYMVYFARLKNRDPVEVLQMVQPFAKLPNSIVAIKSAGLLILRDYSVNIRRMLQVLEKVEKTEPGRPAKVGKPKPRG